MSLVADYGSSDDEDVCLKFTLDDSQIPSENANIPENTVATDIKLESTVKIEDVKKTKKKKIKNPLRSGKKVPLKSSAFYSPFHSEQQLRDSSLEKHVKMTNNTKDLTEINGKKICWNYRKGKCKFGHNCVFAHDSDLVNTKVDSKEPKNKAVATPSFSFVGSSGQPVESKKRKPGLAPGLVPGKRSRTMYKAQQGKEQPWLQR